MMLYVTVSHIIIEFVIHCERNLKNKIDSKLSVVTIIIYHYNTSVHSAHQFRLAVGRTTSSNVLYIRIPCAVIAHIVSYIITRIQNIDNAGGNNKKKIYRNFSTIRPPCTYRTSRSLDVCV